MFAARAPKRVRTLSLVSRRSTSNDVFRIAPRSLPPGRKQRRKMGSKATRRPRTRRSFSGDTDPGLMDWFAEQQGASDVEVLIAMQKIAAR